MNFLDPLTFFKIKKQQSLSLFCFFYILFFSIAIFIILCKVTNPYLILYILMGVLVIYFLIKYSEVTLALFLVVGKFKTDPRLSFLKPLDLTLVLAFLIIISIIVGLILKKKKPHFPKVFMLYLPFILMIIISLSYTPNLDIGLDKAFRFFILTGLAIIAPFWLLLSEKKLKRFFLTLLIAGFLASVNSLNMLGGYNRFVSPGGLSIQLGYDAAVAIIVLWYLLLADLSFFKRIPWYTLFPILFIGLIGSGARRSVVAVFLCSVVGLILYKRMILDLFILSSLGILTLLVIDIPIASLNYLGTLLKYNLTDTFSSRTPLMQIGLDIVSKYPIFGVGIGGYSYFSPNPSLYNYPHNLILEIWSEIGIIAAISIFCLLIASFWEAINNILDKELRYKKLMILILALLIIGFVESSVSGDINDLKPMWLYISLPFVLMSINNIDILNNSHENKKKCKPESSFTFYRNRFINI